MRSDVERALGLDRLLPHGRGGLAFPFTRKVGRHCRAAGRRYALPVARQTGEDPVAVRNLVLAKLESVVGAGLLLFRCLRPRGANRAQIGCAEYEKDRERDMLAHCPVAPAALRRRERVGSNPHRISSWRSRWRNARTCSRARCDSHNLATVMQHPQMDARLRVRMTWIAIKIGAGEGAR